MASEIAPFRIEVAEVELADLRRRLRQIRWPEAELVSDWSQGVPLVYLRELCDNWASDHDWRAAEARLNALPQFQTVIDGVSPSTWCARRCPAMDLAASRTGPAGVSSGSPQRGPN